MLSTRSKRFGLLLPTLLPLLIKEPSHEERFRTYKFVDKRASFSGPKFADGTKCDPRPTYRASDGDEILFPVIPR